MASFINFFLKFQQGGSLRSKRGNFHGKLTQNSILKLLYSGLINKSIEKGIIISTETIEYIRMTPKVCMTLSRKVLDITNSNLLKMLYKYGYLNLLTRERPALREQPNISSRHSVEYFRILRICIRFWKTTEKICLCIVADCQRIKLLLKANNTPQNTY